MMTHKIIFQPSGRRGEVEAGKTILQASRELGVDIEGVCGEKKKCGKCKVRIEEGFFERYGIESKMEHLTPLGLTEEELKFIKTEEEAEGYRLGCVTAITGDVLVFVPEESRAGKQVVRKAATERAIKLDPAIRKFYVELPPPSLHEPMGDWERLTQELKKTYALDHLTIDYFVLRDMPIRIRQGKWNVTVTIWDEKEVVKIEPGFVEKGYGLAIDIGTTTVAAYLCDVTTGG
ncbi:MAG: 2Fe-2S iron-sulfur cluster binding domain-containing protein, partial [Deltaproteobacteria bacterium]|nr:2Fe-2S iron-sulfur cluster binding domain-containing protein [Deltaproteobacteria bacterium]